ncbi:hypothetical protein HK100_000419 [Physocladia obscura]|uniref:Amidohydrolase-related domain-containing protein n=1 Tax=Physocladia obscura TaxID=109957 RepID=A0AAD5XFL6_9FUNG|nr:hypothetical protein HK100_000419 [Physocladia obscura]
MCNHEVPQPTAEKSGRPAPKPTGPHTVIKNVTVFDGTELLEETWDVELNEGKIQRVTVSKSGEHIDGAVEIVDGTGRYLIPGLIDSHIHITDIEKTLSGLGMFGVTTGLDMGCFNEATLRDARGINGRADTRSAGYSATVAQSTHHKLLRMPDASLVNNVDEDDWVAQRVQGGSDYIKLIADMPIGPSQDKLNKLVDAANRVNKLSVVHAVNAQSYHMAVASKCSVLTHAPLDTTIPQSLVTTIHAQNQVCVPTLVFMHMQAHSLLVTAVDTITRHFRRSYTPAAESVRAMFQAGVPIFVGTDCHGDLGPLAPKYGLAVHEEMKLLCDPDVGMPPTQVLQSATSLPATFFGLHDRGSIKPGFRADIVLLDANPVENIQNSRRINKIWINGVPHPLAKTGLISADQTSSNDSSWFSWVFKPN